MSVSIVMRPTAADAGQTIQGLGANYVPAASGLYTVTDSLDVVALLKRGWEVAVTPASGDMWLAALVGVNPSATIATFGAAQNIVPASLASLGILPLSLDIVFGGTFGAETATVQLVVSYSDGTTATVNKTATAVGTTTFANADLRSLVKNGVSITNIAISSKSTIASSLVTVAINAHGFNTTA